MGRGALACIPAGHGQLPSSHPLEGHPRVRGPDSKAFRRSQLPTPLLPSHTHWGFRKKLYWHMMVMKKPTKPSIVMATSPRVTISHSKGDFILSNCPEWEEEEESGWGHLPRKITWLYILGWPVTMTLSCPLVPVPGLAGAASNRARHNKALHSVLMLLK